MPTVITACISHICACEIHVIHVYVHVRHICRYIYRCAYMHLFMYVHGIYWYTYICICDMNIFYIACTHTHTWTRREETGICTDKHTNFHARTCLHQHENTVVRTVRTESARAKVRCLLEGAYVLQSSFSMHTWKMQDLTYTYNTCINPLHAYRVMVPSFMYTTTQNHTKPPCPAHTCSMAAVASVQLETSTICLVCRYLCSCSHLKRPQNVTSRRESL